MTLINEKDQALLRKIFGERLTGDVAVTLYTQHDSPLIVPSQECAYCRETRQLLEELTGLSDRLQLVVKDFVHDADDAKRQGVDRIPAILIEGKAKGQVRFFGVPSGYEFSSLIEDLIDVSTGQPELSPDSLKKIASIKKDVHLQVFVTPT